MIGLDSFTGWLGGGKDKTVSKEIDGESAEKEKFRKIFALILYIRSICYKFPQKEAVDQPTLRNIYTQQKDLLNNTDWYKLPLLSKTLRKKFALQDIPQIEKNLEEAKNANAYNLLKQNRDILLQIAQEIETEIAGNNEQEQEILEFQEHVAKVADLKDQSEVAEKERKRKQKKREILKLLIVAIIDQELVATQSIRNKNTKKGKKEVMVATAVTKTDYMTNDEILALAETVSELDREDILTLNPEIANADAIQDLHVFERYATIKSDKQRDNEQDKRDHANSKLEAFIDKNLEKIDLEYTPENLTEILGIIDKAGIPIDIINIQALLYKNETELIESEQNGPNALQLYREAFLTSPYFHDTGNKQFLGLYLMLATLGMLEDSKYDPLVFSKKLTQNLIVDAYSKRRAGDKETSSGSRWLLVEEVMTYFAWAKESFALTASDDKEKAKIVDRLLDFFWWNEVGRPSIIYKSVNGTPTLNIDEAQRDEYGPVVLNIYNKENVQFPVSKEHGKYYLRKRFTPEARKQTEELDQELFSAATIYYQLHEMVNVRRSQESIGIEQVPLPLRDYYYVTVVINNQWRKIKINSAYFTTDQYGKPGSQENLAEFLFEYSKLIHTTNDYAEDEIHYKPHIDEKIKTAQCTTLREFDQATLQKLQREADRAYSTDRRRHKEKYQHIEKKVQDMDDFTAADLGVVFVSDKDSLLTDKMMRSMLTSTYGAKKQMNLIFGVSQAGKITGMAETLSHRYLDGAPARLEAERSLQQSLDALKSSAKTGEAIKKDILVTNLDQYEEKSKQASKIQVGKIDGEGGLFRERCNNIFSFYKKELGVEIDKNTIIQLAVHLFLDITHTHFLESREGILAPALSFFPSDILIKMKGQHLNRDETLKLIASSQVMKADRMAVKAGNGMVPTSAMLTGAHSASAGLRKLIQTMAETLHKEVTIPLTRSALVSSVSGGKEPIKTHELWEQDTFTTALDGVYLDHGAFGFSDTGDDISITYRTLNDGKSSNDFNEKFNQALSTALLAFEEGMQYFKENPDLRTNYQKPWKQVFQEQSAQRHG